MSSCNLRTNQLKTDTLVDGGEKRGNSSRSSQHCWWVKGRNLPSATFCIQAVPDSNFGRVNNNMIKDFLSFLQPLRETLPYYRTYTATDSFHVLI